MIAKPVAAALDRWRRRMGSARHTGLGSQSWATAADVQVLARLDGTRLHLWIGDPGRMAEAGRDGAEVSTMDGGAVRWHAEASVQDGWLGSDLDSDRALHLDLDRWPVNEVRCHWARTSTQPLRVHLHLPAQRSVEWFDHTGPGELQRTARVWHVADGTQLRLTNVLDLDRTGNVWWDDDWRLASGAQVAWVDQLGEARDVRRRSTVLLQDAAVWRFASVGWLLPHRWHEHDLDVQHQGARSESHLHHRTVLLERTQRRMTGFVRVAPSAVDGLTGQTMQHWLLSDQVVLTASPQLAIGIGALRGATHGAAVGRFDPTVVNAMLARGLPLGPALALVLEGALCQALDLLDDGHPWWDRQREALHQRIGQGTWLDAAQAFWTLESTQESFS